MAGPSRSELARRRLREEAKAKKLSQREIADLLAPWSQSKVGKILTGTVELTVDDLEALCFAIGVSIFETLRDPGLEFVAEMTPLQLRIFTRIQRMTPKELDALATLLNIRPQVGPPRRAFSPGPTSAKKTFGLTPTPIRLSDGASPSEPETQDDRRQAPRHRRPVPERPSGA